MTPDEIKLKNGGVNVLELIDVLKEGYIDGHDGRDKSFVRGHNNALDKVIVMLQQKALPELGKKNENTNRNLDH